jgi:hypothetical protein
LEKKIKIFMEIMKVLKKLQIKPMEEFIIIIHSMLLNEKFYNNFQNELVMKVQKLEFIKYVNYLM